MRFSIVTPSFNQCRFLRLTMESVLSQTGPFELEWHVVDAGSTDGTVDLLRSLENNPRVIWTSEADRGQSDAINKGIQRSIGDIIGWLNSDDLYNTGALAAVAEAFDAHPDRNWLIGRCDIIDADGREIRPGVTKYKNRGLRRYSRRKLLRENFISQPAVFWRRDFREKVGPLDVNLHQAMDYDLWLRMAAAGEPIILDRLLSHFRFHPTSKSGSDDRARFTEDMLVASRHANGDRINLLLHRLNVEKIVWSYRAMRLIGK